MSARVHSRGFTLLEVMIAMAILAGALTWIVVGMSRNIQAENHAKLMSTATFLARGRMVEFRDELYDKGFGEFDKEVDGKFDDKGFDRFKWTIVVDKIQLPTQEQLQSVMTQAQQIQQKMNGTSGTDQPSPADTTSGNPMSASANAMSSQFGLIKDVLEQAIRRVTLDVIWEEGRTPQKVELVAYFTDVRKVDQAIQLSIANAAAALGGGKSGAGGAGTTPPSNPPPAR